MVTCSEEFIVVHVHLYFGSTIQDGPRTYDCQVEFNIKLAPVSISNTLLLSVCVCVYAFTIVYAGRR